MIETLILIPSDLERAHLLPDPKSVRSHAGMDLYESDGAVWAVCGIGPSAAAMTATHLTASLEPSCLILLGVAGAFRGSGLRLGELVQARSEHFADLGYWAGTTFQDLDRMGLPMLTVPERKLGCAYPLAPWIADMPSHDFLTVSTITNSVERAELLRHGYGAGVENMEGAAVAMVCAFYRIPFFEIRAVSNWVGPRDPKSWTVAEPLGRLRDRVLAQLSA